MQRKEIEESVQYVCENGTIEQQLHAADLMLGMWERMYEGRDETPSQPGLLAHQLVSAALTQWRQQRQEIYDMIHGKEMA